MPNENVFMLEPLEPRLLLSSVTFVTHGYNGNTGGWVSAVADAVADRTADPTNTSILTMHVTDAGGPAVSSVILNAGPDPFSASYSGDMVVKLEWGSISGGSFSTAAVANGVADYLLNATINGISFLEAPVHMIGHSRGASLIAVLAERLGERGVWVDHLTFLDPHPVNNGGGDDPLDFGDPPMQVTDNVVFADDYYRRDGILEFVDFDGEPVNGAFNVELDEDTLGGFFNDPGYTLEHSDVHLWYFGTANLNANAHNGDHSVPTDWYNGSQGPRNTIGYAFSNIVGLTKPAAGVANGHGGNGARVATNPIGDQWANLRDLNVNQAGDIERGEFIDLSFSYQDRDSDAQAMIYLDPNGDPLDGNEQLIDTIDLAATGNNVQSWAGQVNTESGIPGTYRIFAEITDGLHRRQQYADGLFSLVDTIAPQVQTSQVNQDQSHRTIVTELTAQFSEDVQVTGSLQLQNLDTGQFVDSAQIASSYEAASQTLHWSFPDLTGGSLPDGNYRATLLAQDVIDVGSNALNDGIDWSIDLFRYYGDEDGDRDVDAADLFRFRQAFNTGGAHPAYDERFDWDGDNDVDAAELFRFRTNFGTRLDEPGSPPQSASQDQLNVNQLAAIYWADEEDDGDSSSVTPIDDLLALA